METINFTVEECKAAISDINRITEEKYPRNQTPGFSNLRKMIENIDEQVKKLLEEKRIEEPDEIEVEETAGETAPAGASGGGAAAGAIAGRADALRRLGEIAAFFQKTEPHSPVSYLVQRAVKWGNMGLETWLQEVIKDQTVLVQLRETLGVTDGASGGPDPNDPWA
jgi:type VI secretion system protein ImpA